VFNHFQLFAWCPNSAIFIFTERLNELQFIWLLFRTCHTSLGYIHGSQLAQQMYLFALHSRARHVYCIFVTVGCSCPFFVLQSSTVFGNVNKFCWELSLHDRLCGLVVRVLGYRSGGPGSIPGTTRFSRKKEGKQVVGLERGPLSLVSITEELLDKKVAAPV
jgi:hypothetical protein